MKLHPLVSFPIQPVWLVTEQGVAKDVEAALEQNKEIHRQIKVYFHS